MRRLGFTQLILLSVLVLSGCITPPVAREKTVLVEEATVPETAPTPETKVEVLQMLGKMKLEEIKQRLPGGLETYVKPEPGTSLSKLGVVSRYIRPDKKVAYYFNSQGVLVSVTVMAAIPLTKEELLRQISGLKFKKYPSSQGEAAFIRRSPTVIQGLYLSADGKYVEMSTYDYSP
jgi:hypothetical protein